MRADTRVAHGGVLPPLLTPVVALVLMAGLVSACGGEPEPDAYGNVEATEVVVSAQTSGILRALAIDEGQSLPAGAVVGTIDATDLKLQRDQLVAQRAAAASRVDEAARQIAALDAQRAAAEATRGAAVAERAALQAQVEIAMKAYDRATRLFDQRAATAQQVDRATQELASSRARVKAQDEQIAAAAQQVTAYDRQVAAARAQRETLQRQVASADAQVAQADERIRKSEITNPVAGTVLVTYVEQGELVQTGQPLYRIADLDEVEVRAYITEPQLASVTLGSEAQITIDAGQQRRTLTGTVSWIADEAEFTPTPIQTREERANLVYAIKIRVPNTDGLLKIGMPVDVQLAAGR